MKTKTADYDGWQWNVRKDGTIFVNLHTDGDFVVMFDLGGVSQPNRYFVVPTHIVDDWLTKDFQDWLRAARQARSATRPTEQAPDSAMVKVQTED